VVSLALSIVSDGVYAKGKAAKQAVFFCVSKTVLCSISMEQLIGELLKALVQYVLAPLAGRWLEERLKSKRKTNRKH
jgi:small-conductance mechanosensitive channel